VLDQIVLSIYHAKLDGNLEPKVKKRDIGRKIVKAILHP
jgi:hypothetical protein